MKPIIHFTPSKGDQIRRGWRALVYPIDHTSEYVSNTGPVLTSLVVKINHVYEGKVIDFETENTHYRAYPNAQNGI